MALDVIKLYVSILSEFFMFSDMAVMSPGRTTAPPAFPTCSNSLTTAHHLMKILGEIQDGSFAKEWVSEDEGGRPNFNKLQQAGNDHQIEEVGKKLRALMSWTK